MAIKQGDKVRVKTGAKTYEGKGVAAFVYKNTYTVDELKGSRAVLNKKGICTAFNVKDLIPAAATNNQVYNALVTCLDAIEDLPEFKTLEDLLNGRN